MILFVLFFLLGGIFLGIGINMLHKPEKLKRQCTQTVQGTVIDYYKEDAGDISGVDDSTLDHDTGIRRPVTQYSVNGETYITIGPEYMCYTDIHLQTFPEEKGTFDFSNGKIHVHAVRDKWMVHKFNPYEQLFPLGTKVTVHYDPKNPKFSYANDILEKKLIGRIFFFWGLGMFAAAVIVFLKEVTG
jgi:hypothetical protein